MKLFNWIILIIFVFIFGWCVIVQNRYLDLEDKYNEMINSQSNIIDSLNVVNKQSENTIVELRDSLINIEKELSIVSNKTIEVETKTCTVSSSFSESVTILNNNLKWIEL